MKILTAIAILTLTFCVLDASDFDSAFGRVPTVSKKEAAAISEAREAGGEDAVKVLSAASKNDWAGSAVFFNLANLYASAGRFNEAADNYKMALKKLPSFFMAQKNLAMVLSESGNKPAAFAEMKKALALSGGSDSDILLWMASYHIENGDYSEALFCCNQALVYDSQNARAKTVKARILLRLDMLGECRAVCLSLLSESVKNTEALETLVVCRAKEGDYAGAISAAEIARALGANTTSSVEIADLYFSAGLYSDAAKEYASRAKAVSKNSLKNALFAMISDGKYAEARKFALGLGLPDSRQISAAAFAAEGKKSEAIAEYAGYFDAGGNDAKAHFEYAVLLLEKGDAVSAGPHFDAASKDSAYALAALYGKLRAAAAESDFMEALKIAKRIQSVEKSDEIELYIKYLNELDKSAQ